MSNNSAETIKKSFSWSSVAVLASLLLTILGIYLTAHEKKPDVVFQIKAESNILDVHKPIKDLTISFRGNNINTSNKNLKFYLITLKNSGDKDIVQSDFDANQTWGLRFENSEIVESPKIIDSNSAYLKSNLNPNIVNGSLVEFSKVIFEKDKFATFEVKVLHANDKPPVVTPTGKIAGVETQRVEHYQSLNEGVSFLNQVTEGSVPVLIVRAFGYLAIFIIFLIILISTSDWFNGLGRKNNKKRLKEYLDPVLSKYDDDDEEFIFSFCHMFLGKTQEITDFLTALEDPVALEEIKESRDRHLQEKQNTRERKEKMKSSVIKKNSIFYRTDIQEKLFDFHENGEVTVNSHIKELLRKIIQHMEKKPLPKKTSWLRH